MDSEEPLTKLAEEGSPHLKCPVCGKVYTEPVINILCGHTFCRHCADSISVCPVDNAGCVKEQLVVNRLVVGQIDDLKIHCRYGVLIKDGELVLDPSGCPEIIVFGQRAAHEESCPFALVPCPNSSACGLLRRSKLEEHRLVCKSVPNALMHNDTGVRLQNCGCETYQSEVSRLTNTVDKLEKTNAALRSQVDSLSQKVDTLEQFKTDASSCLDRCASMLSSLQQQYERLASQMQQQALTGHPVRKSLYSSSTSLAEMSGTQSRGTAASHSPSSPSGVEKWEMPFQFKCIGTLRGHQDIVWCLAAYRGRLYSAGNDKVIKVWNVDQLAKGCVDNFRGHTDRIHAMVNRGNKLFTGGADSSIRCWETETGAQAGIVEGAHDNIICAMAIAGEHLFTSSFSLIKVWNLKTLTMVKSFSGLHHWVRALAVSPDKKLQWLH